MYGRIASNLNTNRPAVDKFCKIVRYILGNFPTSKPHNRFDVGGAIEICIVDLLREACPGYVIENPDNAVLTDITINGRPVSIKWSGGASNVILKNTLGNAAMTPEFPDLFLLKPKGLYILTNDILRDKCGISDIFEKNGDGKGIWYAWTSDNYSMKNKVLTEINKLRDFPYKIDMDLTVPPEKRKDGHCAKYFYDNIIVDMALEEIIPVE